MRFEAWFDQAAPHAMQDNGASSEAETSISDLAERLNNSDGAELRARLLSRLAQLRSDFDAKVRSGLDPESYRRTMTLIEALASANSFLVRKSRP